VKQHEDFSREMEAFQKQFIKGNDFIAPGVLSYLKDWLMRRILDSDAKLGQFECAAGKKFPLLIFVRTQLNLR